MADFCNQCAHELGLPEGDLCYVRKDPDGKPMVLTPGEGWMELCEGCGPCVVDSEGNCLSLHCDKRHGEVHYELGTKAQNQT